MDAEDNNMNQGVHMVNEVCELVNSLIDIIGTDNLQEQELEVANQKLEATRERLIELRDVAQAMQEAQEAQVRQPNPNPPQQPQEGMNLAIGNVWRPLVENETSYKANPTCHVDHLKCFLNTLEQRVGNSDLFEVYYEGSKTGEAHCPVFSSTVGVTSQILLDGEEDFQGEGTGNTKKVAEKAALFNLFEQGRSDRMLQFYRNALEFEQEMSEDQSM